MTTLIVADPWDVHAGSVAWALENEGEPVHIWYTHDFPQKHHVSLRVGGGRDAGTRLHCLRHGHDFDTDDIDTVWLRRWYRPEASSELHPADKYFSQLESTEFVRATMQLLSKRERFWVNSVEAKARADRT
ncbi:MAG: MvdC/MvdD family ATP grasp protein, partial [Lysobacter sp.]